MRLSLLEAARKAFLLTIARRGNVPVARSYLAEKIEYAYRCTDVQELRGVLDLRSQTVFNNILDESHAPVKP